MKTYMKKDERYKIRSFQVQLKAGETRPEGEPVTSPARASAIFRDVARTLDFGLSVEHFFCLFLNTQNELIGFKTFQTGTVDQVAVYPRTIIHTALMIGAGGVILGHNHPSGAVEPSENDRVLTRQIREAGRLFDINVLDHVIVGEDRYYSFKEGGLI